MLTELHEAVRPDRRSAVAAQLVTLEAVVRRSFDDPAERAFAAGADRAGIGSPAIPDPLAHTAIPGPAAAGRPLG
jgi:hypothetical protein